MSHKISIKFKVGDLVQLNPKIYNKKMINTNGFGIIKNNKVTNLSGDLIYEIAWKNPNKQIGKNFLGRYISPIKK